MKDKFLEGLVLSLVKSVNDIDKIWHKLKKGYSDPRILLSRKLAEMCNFDALWKMRAPSKIIAFLSKIINIKLKPNCTIEMQLRKFTSSWVIEELMMAVERL